MINHTPAPWFEDIHAESETMIQAIQENPSWIAVADNQDNGGHVAYCHPDNANVIAAAPELFNALKDSLKIITQHNLNSTATREERSATIKRLTDWQNSIIPVLEKAGLNIWNEK